LPKSAVKWLNFAGQFGGEAPRRRITVARGFFE
jgi:hypothetical protein